MLWLSSRYQPQHRPGRGGGDPVENCYYSDGPCGPSRTALYTGRFGIHTGVVDHLGTAADHFVEGPPRGFRSTLGKTNWMRCLRDQGYRTVTVSAFAERHSQFNWLAGFSEIYNVDRQSVEMAEEMSSLAIDWLERNGQEDDWFLHVNFWDVHWPYRTPDDFGDPFKDEPIPAWLTEEIRQEHWDGCGIRSAQDTFSFHVRFPKYPRTPGQMTSMHEVRKMFDGYDTSLRYVDSHIGFLLDTLARLGVLENTAVIISADHGESLGELNIYAGHRLADQCSARQPLIVRWPGVPPRSGGGVDWALHYQFDLAATVVELVEGTVPENWDGSSFAETIGTGAESGRDYLVFSAGAASFTRSIRFDDYLCIRLYHDGYQCFPNDVLLFDVTRDPHEQYDLAPERPDLVGRAMILLDAWYGQMLHSATHAQDPMWSVIVEGWAPGYARLAAGLHRAPVPDR